MHPLLVTVGSATVRVYGRGSGARWDVVYRLNGVRKMESRGSESAAMARAREVAKLLDRGRANLLTLRVEDGASYSAAMRTLAGIGVPLSVAVEEYAAARKRLGLRGSVLEAAEFFARSAPAERREVKVSEAVEGFLAEKRADGVHPDYLANLSRTLGRFAREVGGCLGDVTPGSVKGWLGTLEAKGRTLANYRAWVVQLFRWARANRMLAHDRQTAAEAVRLPKYGKARVEPFRPAELERLLTTAPRECVAWLALGAFAGLRPSEICRLRWEAFDWGRGVIRIGDEVAMKTRQARRVPIDPALAHWLRGVRLPTGKVTLWDEKKMRRVCTEHAADAGVKWRKNGLRVSHGSYLFAVLKNEFQVAARMGHDPATFWREYREDCDDAVAAAWFGVGLQKTVANCRGEQVEQKK